MNTEHKKENRTESINASNESELQLWSAKFGISEDLLKRAIVDVGTNARLVKEIIGKKYLN